MTFEENWHNLSNWRKGVLSILTIMWLTFSAAIIISVSSWFFAILALCGIWLIYLAFAYFITNDIGNCY